MKMVLMVAGAAAFSFTGPALAKPGHGQGKGNPHAHGVAAVGCPPGLAKKGTGCLPPGQAKKLYGVGQRWPTNYGYAWNYNQIPNDLRTRYAFNPDYRYYYGDGYLYRVDPRTMLISQVVSAVLR